MRIYSQMGSFKERYQETLYRRLRLKKAKLYRKRASMRHRRHRDWTRAHFTRLSRLILVLQIITFGQKLLR